MVLAEVREVELDDVEDAGCEVEEVDPLDAEVVVNGELVDVDCCAELEVESD